MAVKLKIRKGDTVTVVTGRDRGRTGEVLRVVPGQRRVVVQGVNMVKRHTKPSPASPGGVIEKEATIDISNVALVDPGDGRPARVGFRVLEDGRKVRYARRSGEVIDR